MKSVAARVIVAVLVVLVWLGISCAGGPTFGKLSQVSSNDQATFLPATAESTKAGEFVQEFIESSQIPAIVVSEFAELVAPQQIGELAPLADELKQIEGVDGVIGPIPADDGQAVQYIALINTDEVEATDAVDEMRAMLTDPNTAAANQGPLDGATIHVAGPAGISADLGNAFAGIDGVL